MTWPIECQTTASFNHASRRWQTRKNSYFRKIRNKIEDSKTAYVNAAITMTLGI